MRQFCARLILRVTLSALLVIELPNSGIASQSRMDVVLKTDVHRFFSSLPIRDR